MTGDGFDNRNLWQKANLYERCLLIWLAVLAIIGSGSFVVWIGSMPYDIMPWWARAMLFIGIGMAPIIAYVCLCALSAGRPLPFQRETHQGETADTG